MVLAADSRVSWRLAEGKIQIADELQKVYNPLPYIGMAFAGSVAEIQRVFNKISSGLRRYPVGGAWKPHAAAMPSGHLGLYSQTRERASSGR